MPDKPHEPVEIAEPTERWRTKRGRKPRKAPRERSAHEIELKELGERVNVRFEHDVHTIGTIYAWVAVNDATGHEGLIHATLGNQKTTLIATTLRQIAEFRQRAFSTTRQMKVTVKLVRFTRREL
jgi:SH3-like domain-containing protein